MARPSQYLPEMTQPGRAHGSEREPVESLDFDQIYETEFGYVWNCLRRLGIPESDLPDLAHEVFLRVFGALAQYDRQRPLRPWLFGVCLRTASDFRRLARHRREVGSNSADMADVASGAEQHLGEEEDRRLVVAALQDLRLERRAVLVMHKIDGLTVPEISEALGVPLNTVYSRLRRGLADFTIAVRRLRKTYRG
jgi:RNA polymerase sigma-70 factor (ECF subfamily)